ncbi:tRNA lysidine(34) synthetase TilS [Campylobacter novaezeelandiae]|uniref:tRNA lysidine(34) synthetase TilS n=1 Tax=Campylobacter novaezeelandiae TaxID=2267891 RepID=UPI0019030D9C|nr:tRNA lysidine(34) synthetase TilS [Campylobacter novaezeelandiae]MBK1963792.1 tRNA lysidine(34) synthetase TilS [Campylobacter novaezeelandiae]MBK1993638.1 tRNA lysidine(34) synthetase TilS [Campylobacter novaezeelandiae]
MQIKEEILEFLRKGKNLLAFSYGSDSTALFYFLMQEKIEFDLAMINYKTRKNSDLEEDEAKKLAFKFNKQIFTISAPFFKNNFEQNARAFRYDFFEKICFKYHYNNLILAHHLNDQLEWFLMQLSRGAGVIELLGMSEFEKCKNYNLLRPLLFTSKNKILSFLNKENIKYFNDESNENEKYFRNYIRKHFSNDFVKEFEEGLKKSFKYIQKDKEKLFDIEKIKEFKDLLICPRDEGYIAKAVKIQGIVLSAAQRKEALKGDCVLGGKIGVVYKDKSAIVFKHEICEKLPKKFKEECRIFKIPRLLRAYLYNHHISPSDFILQF